jgi:ribosomal protein L11 methyltransferase
MTDYIELNCQPQSSENAEMLMALLGDAGFESFTETETGFLAYIPEKLFDATEFQKLELHKIPSLAFSYTVKHIPAQNWNAVWESNFPPVLIPGKCQIRASFHAQDPSVPMEIIIDPKMSFGTGHHETTRMLSEWCFDVDFRGRSVIDMGCGTGVLAILAAKLGASKLTAIDIEEWACENSRENAERNGVEDMEVVFGDAAALLNRRADIVFANINRNVLLSDMQHYADALNPGGLLLMSGFYSEDLPAVSSSAAQFSMPLLRSVLLNNWCASMHQKSK